MVIHRLPSLDRFLWIGFLIGIIPAIYPAFVYIDTQDSVRPFLLLGAIACLHAALLLRSYSVAIRIHRETPLSNETGVTYHTVWRLAFRRIWGWHVAFAILRLGLAVAFAQVLHTSLASTCSHRGLYPFCFWSCNCIGGIPQIIAFTIGQFVVALVTLVVYSVFEAGLSSALAGFVMNRWHRPPIQAKHLVLIVVVLRAGLAVGGLAAYNLFIAINEWATRGDDAALCSLLSESDAIVDDYWGVDSRYLSSIMPHMMLENVAIIPFTLVDNATLLSSDLMRQSWYWLAIAQRIPALLGGLLLYIGVIRGLLRASSGGYP